MTTTKKTVVTNEEKLYYPPEDIFMEEYPGCCGIEIASNFALDECEEVHEEWRKESYYGYKPTKPLTLSQWHNKAYKQITDKRSCRHTQLSLVTKFKNKSSTEQVTGFKDFLLGKKWYIIDEFVNPNHGNTVCVLGKTFPKKKKSKAIGRGLYW